jgi:Protein of unknown function (DUF1501)
VDLAAIPETICKVENPVHVRDFHATILRLKGLDHERLTYRHAGLDFRLSGVEHALVVTGVLALETV